MSPYDIRRRLWLVRRLADASLTRREWLHYWDTETRYLVRLKEALS